MIPAGGAWANSSCGRRFRGREDTGTVRGRAGPRLEPDDYEELRRQAFADRLPVAVQAREYILEKIAEKRANPPRGSKQ
jgi:hypothetical protein